MTEFELKPDEYILLRSEQVTRSRLNPLTGSQVDGISRAVMGGSNVEIVLTNRAIACITKTMFGRVKSIERLPLADIKVIDGRPRVTANKATLEVSFPNRQETFQFYNKSDVKNWERSIFNLLTGNVDDLHEPQHKAIPGSTYVAETLKGTFDTFKHTFKSRSSGAGENISRFCTSCGASVSGRVEQIVRCQHCGNDQVLK